jgi:hypothetical protein
LAQHLEAAKDALQKRTWEGHEETARVHLVPMLGHLKLSFHDLRHSCAILHFSLRVYILRWFRNFWDMPPSTLRSTPTRTSYQEWEVRQLRLWTIP